jgi:fructosamine-3-kinase
MPAVLTHGDLWRNNIVATTAAEPAFIDPAVCWMWAEADLSMALCAGGMPARFFHAYNEVHPLEDGWRERAELLNLRELLSIVAHFGAVWDVPARIARVVRRFAG